MHRRQVGGVRQVSGPDSPLPQLRLMQNHRGGQRLKLRYILCIELQRGISTDLCISVLLTFIDHSVSSQSRIALRSLPVSQSNTTIPSARTVRKTMLDHEWTEPTRKSVLSSRRKEKLQVKVRARGTRSKEDWEQYLHHASEGLVISLESLVANAAQTHAVFVTPVMAPLDPLPFRDLFPPSLPPCILV